MTCYCGPFAPNCQENHVFVCGETLCSENCSLAKKKKLLPFPFQSVQKMVRKKTDSVLAVNWAFLPAVMDWTGLERPQRTRSLHPPGGYKSAGSMLFILHENIVSYERQSRETDAFMPVRPLRIIAVIGWETGHALIFKGDANNCWGMSGVTHYKPGFGLCGKAWSVHSNYSLRSLLACF